MRSSEITVLGGGPAGLATALFAARAGHDVTLYERAGVLGGLAGSYEVAGIRVDHGSHRLHPRMPAEVLGEIQGLLGADLQRRPRRGRIRLAGRWLAFPLRPADLLRRLPPSFAGGAALDALAAPLRRARGDSFAEVLRAGVGPTLCRRFWFPYARKVWGLAPTALAGEVARRRIATGGVGALARRVLRPEPDRDIFLYPRRGFGQLVERLAEAATAAGARLETGAPVEELELSSDGARVRVAGRDHRTRLVVSTIPLPALARLASAPDAVLRAARGLATRAMVLVHLVVATGRFTPFDAHYLPEEFTPITRISEPTAYRDGDDPDDRTVITAEIPCTAGDPLWRADTATLARIVSGTLARCGLPQPPIEDAEVRRLPSAYPVLDLEGPARLATLSDWAAEQPSLMTLGRQGSFAHDNTHHALIAARDAVSAVTPSGRIDHAAWAAARARHAHHVVED